jgi:sporulation protein YlmC with PRC-barrel domain
MLSRIAIAAVVAMGVGGTAVAQQTTTGAAMSTQSQTLTALPTNAMTVTNWYKQNLYDPSDTKIGQIADVLINKDGKIDAFIVSVGGFLGIDSKDVAVPFSAVQATMKNDKWYLTMNTTKDALKSASGYKYDSNRLTWVPA